MTNPWLKRVASAVLAILLFVYIGYQIYNSNYSSVRTEIVLDAQEAETIQVSGAAVRQEVLIQNDSPGVVAYTLSDGSKVAKEGVVAEIYATSQDATAQQQLKSLNVQIDRLNSLSQPGNTHSLDQVTVTDQIERELVSLLDCVEKNDMKTLSDTREDFLNLINEYQIATKKVTDFNGRVASLTAQRDSLAATGGKTGNVVSPASGYFISEADGWENIFDFGSVLTLTANELEQKLQSSPQAAPNVVGKVCADYNWYFVGLVSSEDAERIRDAVKNGTGQVALSFPFVSSKSVPATVASVNQADENGKAAVLFLCNRMNDELARLRNTEAKVQISNYSGLRVSQKAIRFQTVEKKVKAEDGTVSTISQEVKGVYVMHGNEILFRQIFPLYSTANYVICDPSPNEDELMTSQTVKLYDEIVVEGTELFDGKVIK